ncbi:hypothetical protein BT93_C1556 [Corymbia citriodora subsp. variegata]|nr:hypothetical protein BT93_C1556 [Corymbia citriodora subsp. variegata]
MEDKSLKGFPKDSIITHLYNGHSSTTTAPSFPLKTLKPKIFLSCEASHRIRCGFTRSFLLEELFVL